MPIFDVEANGRQFEIEAPDMASAQAALTQHLGGPAQQPAASPILPDVGKSLASGVASGVAGMVGGPRTESDLIRSGADYLTGGGPLSNILSGAISSINPLSRLAPYMPTTQQATKAIESVTGPLYKPQTGYGQAAHTVGEFLPGSVFAGSGGPVSRIVTGAVLPGLASEGAGQLTEGTGLEGPARIGGAMAGAMLPGTFARAVTPNPISAERAAALNVLRSEGVQPPASMATGSKILRAADSELGGSAYDAALTRMNEQFTAAALKRAGIRGENRATPEIINAAEDRIGKAFDDVAARNPRIPLDQQFVTKAVQIADDFKDLTGARSPLLDRLIKEVQDTGQRPAIAGASYQAKSSEIARMIRGTSQSELRMSLQDLKSSLDAAIERGLSNPADIQAWKQARREWANTIVLNRAVSTSTEAAANGLISPARLSQAIDSMKRGNYSHGRGDFAELARAGNQIMKSFQDSGTPARVRTMAIPAAIGAVAGAGLGALPGAALGIAAPYVAGRAMMSRPVQAYLQNQALAKVLRQLQTGRNVAVQGGNTYQQLMGM